ncbi:hypothetical protein C4577_02845 [Candidatus Parcubacteria bacterium]|nr:MAG: hypothetical protein C4577_02845 [Candidatus Parcubacteria bacterium]
MFDEWNEIPNWEESQKELRKRQEEHLKSVRKIKRQSCLHDSCLECVGTGIKKDGTRCIHMLSCSCPKCSPYYMRCPDNSDPCFPHPFRSNQDYDDWAMNGG